MSYNVIRNNTYLSTNGIEYYGWIGRHILDPDNFYSSKSDNPKIKLTAKLCKICNEPRLITDFYKNSKGTDSMCKKCRHKKIYNNRRASPYKYFVGKLRSRLSDAIRSRGIKKDKSTIDLLGCTPKEAYNYIVSKFTEGMTLEAFDNGLIHIDHIKPIASFDLTDTEQQKICFHYTNLQPLWAIDNIRKKDKIIN